MEYKMEKKILIHCLAGNQRSAIVVVAVLMKINEWTKNESIRYLVKRKPNVFNFGTDIHFINSL